MPGQPPKKSIMRSLGEFFGHIAHAVRTDPAAGTPPESEEPNRRVVRETIEEEERQTPLGKVTLRRTIVEEVELPPPPSPPSPPPPPTPAPPATPDPLASPGPLPGSEGRRT